MKKFRISNFEFRIFKNPTFLLILILVLAAFLRLYKIADYMTFLGDEGRDVLVVRHILHGNFTLLGPTASVGGFFLGPIYYYFMVPFLFLFNYDPVGPAVMVALFGIATVFLVYKIGGEFFNQKAGIIAALFYAISPLVIGFSRSSWNPNLMPFFTLLLLYTLYKASKKRSLKHFLFAGFLYGIAIQLHYIEVFVGVISFFYIIFSCLLENKFIPKNITYSIGLFIKRILLFFSGFIFGLFPFFLFELRHNFPNTKSIANFIFHSKEVNTGDNFVAIIMDVTFRLFGRLITNFPPLEQISVSNSMTKLDVYFATYTYPIAYLYWFTVVLVIGSLSLLIFKLYKSSKHTTKMLQLSLLAIWFIFGVLPFGYYKKEIYDYYFEFMFPLPFLLVGNLIVFLISKNIPLKVVGAGTLTILLALNLQSLPFRSLANKQLDQVRTISKFVFDKAGSEPFNFAIIARGNSDHAYRYFFEVWGNAPVVVQYPGIDPDRKSVTDQLFVICEQKCAPLGDSLWEVAGFGQAEIKGEWNVSVVKVYKLEHYKVTK